jgi:peptide deformylase
MEIPMSNRIERGALPIGSELAVASLIMQTTENRRVVHISPRTAMSGLVSAALSGVVEDGVALQSVAHPEPPVPDDLSVAYREPSPESLETVEVEAPVRDENLCQSCDDDGDCTSGDACVALSNPAAIMVVADDLGNITRTQISHEEMVLRSEQPLRLIKTPDDILSSLAGNGTYVPRVRAILQNPDPRLRDVCTPIDFDSEQHMAALPFLVADMRATLRASGNGVGLAANQIGVRARVVIVDRSNRGVDEYVMVNPEIIERSKDMQRVPDGCLSVKRGTFHLATKRAKRIRVRWRNVDGVPVLMKFSGLMAAIIQHEVDHLNGRLFTDPMEAA